MSGLTGSPKLFSPVLALETQTHALFQPGNVVLTGLQGSGKTALLNLLRPDVMIAYRRLEAEWPLPDNLSKFVAAGINLNSSKARDFGAAHIPTCGGRGRHKRAFVRGLSELLAR